MSKIKSLLITIIIMIFFGMQEYRISLAQDSLNLANVEINLRNYESIIKEQIENNNIKNLDGYFYYIYNTKNGDKIHNISSKELLSSNFINRQLKFDEYIVTIGAKKIDRTLWHIVIFVIVFVLVYLIIYALFKAHIKEQIEFKRLISQFFNDAMHELKTPLGVATINLEMLQTRNKYTHRIKSALRQMKITYEDVEYYIKNRKINIDKNRLNFSNHLRNRVKFCSTMANVKNIEICTDIDDEIYIYISEIEATRLIDNNITNAIKYSSENDKIYISLKSSDNQARLRIKDYGIGIKDTKEIFRRYFREDSASGGFGIGLNIVQKICKEYNIKIAVASRVGFGSVFSYYIPIFNTKFLDNV